MKEPEIEGETVGGRGGVLNVEMKLRRPNVVAIFLWITGIMLLVMTFYMVFTWQESASMRDFILFLLRGKPYVKPESAFLFLFLCIGST